MRTTNQIDEIRFISLEMVHSLRTLETDCENTPRTVEQCDNIKESILDAIGSLNNWIVTVGGEHGKRGRDTAFSSSGMFAAYANDFVHDAEILINEIYHLSLLCDALEWEKADRMIAWMDRAVGRTMLKVRQLTHALESIRYRLEVMP